MYLAERLRPAHQLGEFSSGEQALDDWLTKRARDSQLRGLAQTYVWCDQDTLKVCAYYAVCPHSVERIELPTASLRKNKPDTLPAMLLCQFALDESLHGQGLGKQLLVEALDRMIGFSGDMGGSLIVVHPLNDKARSFYDAHNFKTLKDDHRQFITVAAAAKALSS